MHLIIGVYATFESQFCISAHTGVVVCNNQYFYYEIPYFSNAAAEEGSHYYHLFSGGSVSSRFDFLLSHYNVTLGTLSCSLNFDRESVGFLFTEVNPQWNNAESRQWSLWSVAENHHLQIVAPLTPAHNKNVCNLHIKCARTASLPLTGKLASLSKNRHAALRLESCTSFVAEQLQHKQRSSIGAGAWLTRS